MAIPKGFFIPIPYGNGRVNNLSATTNYGHTLTLYVWNKINTTLGEEERREMTNNPDPKSGGMLTKKFIFERQTLGDQTFFGYRPAIKTKNARTENHLGIS